MPRGIYKRKYKSHGGQKPTCLCGECVICIRRVYKREWEKRRFPKETKRKYTARVERKELKMGTEPGSRVSISRPREFC